MAARSMEEPWRRMVRKKSAVGTKMENWSLGCPPVPLAGPRASKPGPSRRMWTGVPADVRDERCRAATRPISPWPTVRRVSAYSDPRQEARAASVAIAAPAAPARRNSRRSSEFR